MNDVESLDGRKMVVSGGASGIGAAIVSLAVARGAHVVAVDLDESRLQDLADRWPGRVTPVRGDVTSEESVRHVVQQAAAQMGGIDNLFNVAGGARTAPINELSIADWDFTIDVNLRSCFLMTREAIRHIPGGGSIVNIASLNSHVPMWGGSAYASAKAGVEMFTRNSALELADAGIRVNALLPGLVATPLTSAVTSNPELMSAFLHRIPLGEAADASDIAAPALFLVSDAARYVTGASLVVDGGWELTGYPDLRPRKARSVR